VLRLDGASPAAKAGAVRADGRPVVLVLRDADRHAWQRGAADALLASIPGPVVVDVGLPGGRPRAARGYLATYGAGRANLEAAVERLVPR
jgi:beta-N-acetylhexosaminidase